MAGNLLLEAGIVFGVLAVGGALAVRVGQSVIPAYIVAGLLIGSHAPVVGGVITSERDIYAAVFFFSIGLATDIRIFGAVLVPLVVLVAVTSATKLASGFVGGRAYGLSDRRSVRMALAMVPRGEFSLVLAALAATAGTTPALRQTIPALAVGYVLVMSVLGTVLMRYSDGFERLVAAA